MKRLTDQEKVEIVDKYLKRDTNCSILGREYGVSLNSIFRLLKRRGVELRKISDIRRKYSINESYFDVINTEDKAYFLGLLYADGYNCEQRNEILLELQETDKDILEKFNLAIGSNKPFQFMEKRSKKPTWQNTNRVAISSRHMSQSLAKLGCFQKKSFTLEFPTEEQVPSHLIHHFVRGYFDGDGYFGIYERENGLIYNFAITSSENFCTKLQNIIIDKFNVNCKMYTRFPERNNSTREIKVTGYSSIYKVLDWMYKDSSVYMNRKYNKYIIGQKYVEPAKLSVKDLICINGVTKPISEWLKIFNIDIINVRSRVSHGYTKEEAVSKPVRKCKKRDKNDSHNHTQ